jgi:DNA-binding IclR family transcriptional regulator
MSGLARVMEVLRLFSPEHDAWTVHDMAEALHGPPSTLYRHIADMVTAGLLESGSGARYRLGPAFVEFDRLVRLTDPLVQCGAPMLRRLVDEADVPCVALLCRLYNATVMCVADAATPSIGFSSGFERGRPMPPLRGAASRAILAHLPPRRLAGVLRQSGDASTWPGGSEAALRAELKTIRKSRIAISHGEVTPGLVGFAAPVLSLSLGLRASLTVTITADALDATTRHRVAAMVVEAARALSVALAGHTSPAGAPELITAGGYHENISKLTPPQNPATLGASRHISGADHHDI